MPKQRLDLLLVERGLSESREKAQRLIRAGKIRIKEQIASKPGVQVDTEVEITVDGGERFVSRGGDKLMGALTAWPDIHLQDRICIDIGSSTGGFTDCMLQHGAKQVYAVDVGKGQLHWDLRNDDRVVVMEQTNARYLESADFDPTPTFCSIDVSFISLTRILPAAVEVMSDGGEILSLIKPQFEAGAKFLRKGVVRDPEVHDRVVAEIQKFGTEELPLEWLGLSTSPLKGPKGNIEFLAHWRLLE